MGTYVIHTPGVGDFSLIKKEILVMEAGHIRMKTTYPNGFVMLTDLYPDRTSVKCNAPLTCNADGSYTAPTDCAIG